MLPQISSPNVSSRGKYPPQFEFDQRMPTGVTIIIPSYRRPEPLRLTVADLGRLRPIHGEVLVVEQSPETAFATEETTLENGMPLRVLRRPPGVVAARNAAAAVARHEVLLF